MNQRWKSFVNSTVSSATMNMYKCTTGNMSTVSARAPVILLFLIRSSKESQEKSGSSNIFICIWTAMKCIKYMFLMVYFIPPKSNGIRKNNSISADKDFSPLRRYIFRRRNLLIKNIDKYHINPTEKTQLLLLLSLFKSSAIMYLCIHSFINVFFHLFMKKYQNSRRINKSWKGTSRLWGNLR